MSDTNSPGSPSEPGTVKEFINCIGKNWGDRVASGVFDHIIKNIDDNAPLSCLACGEAMPDGATSHLLLDDSSTDLQIVCPVQQQLEEQIELLGTFVGQASGTGLDAFMLDEDDQPSSPSSSLLHAFERTTHGIAFNPDAELEPDTLALWEMIYGQLGNMEVELKGTVEQLSQDTDMISCDDS